MSYEPGHIYPGDCRDVMSDMARHMGEGEVALIMTSPPYADKRRHTYGGPTPTQYVPWWLERSCLMHRILSDTGSLVVNIKEHVVKGERSTYVLELILAMRRQGWLWTDEYVWHKTTASPGKWPNRFRDCWERLLHFTKQRKFAMYQEAVMVPMGAWAQKRLARLGENDLFRHESASGSGVGRHMAAWRERTMAYPGNVLHGSPVAHNTGHSAAYPEWLPEWFIRLFTVKGDVVLDPFSGSHTTVRVAQRMGRRAFGIEKSLDEEVRV